MARRTSLIACCRRRRIVNGCCPRSRRSVARSSPSRSSLPLVVAQTDQRGLVVKMEPRGSVSGHVIDTNGAPVASVSVDAKRLDDDKAMQISVNDRRKGEATTKPDGSFTIVELEAGKYRVKAVSGREEWSEGLPDGKKSAAPKPPRKNVAAVELVGATAKTGITLTVDARDGVIRGNVIAPDKKPAADSWVTARRVFERPEGMARGFDGGLRLVAAGAHERRRSVHDRQAPEGHVQPHRRRTTGCDPRGEARRQDRRQRHDPARVARHTHRQGHAGRHAGDQVRHRVQR